MNIAAICRRKVVTIGAGASLREAATLMRAQHVGALVVTAESAGHEQAVGIITDRDMAIEILARDLNPIDVKVGQLASRHLVSVPMTGDIAEAIGTMQNAGVRRLLVTEREGEVAGFVSADDLLEALAQQLGGLSSAMRTGIAREGTEREVISPPRPRPVFLPMGTPGMQKQIVAR